MPSLTTLIAAGISAVCVLPVLAFAAITSTGHCTGIAPQRPPSATPTPPTAARQASAPGWDNEQRENAAVIVRTGADLDVSPQGWVIAVAAAIQESSLRNIAYGDLAGPDSRGLFQQRAAWGPLSLRMNPASAARLFYTGGAEGQPGLLDIPGWQQMPLTQAANAVQRSAHPRAYADHEAEALALVASVTAVDPEELSAGLGHCSPACPALSVSTADCADATEVFARAQSWLTAWHGGPVPYRASTNPDTLFDGYRRDCSGYVSMALGLPGPGLNTRALAANSTRISKIQLRPGDLLINTAPNLRGHVVLFERWADPSMTSYYGYEQSGDGGTHHRRIPYPYFGTYSMTPYEFKAHTSKTA